MWRRLIFGILSIGIIAVGVIAFSRLNYWERSLRIFRMGNEEMRFAGRGGPRGFDGMDRRGALPDSIRARFEGAERDRRSRDGVPDSIRARFDAGEMERRFGDDIPDSLRVRFDAGERDRRFRERTVPDSIPSRIDQFNGERRDRERYEAGFRDRAGPGRGDSRRGRDVRLNTVIRFLAVFAAFTVLAIYSDQAWRRFRKGKRKT